jgi:hypothetical protein
MIKKRCYLGYGTRVLVAKKKCLFVNRGLHGLGVFE